LKKNKNLLFKSIFSDYIWTVLAVYFLSPFFNGFSAHRGHISFSFGGAGFAYIDNCHIYMTIYVYVFMYTYTYIYIYLYIYICLCIHTYVYINISINIYIYLSIYMGRSLQDLLLFLDFINKMNKIYVYIWINKWVFLVHTFWHSLHSKTSIPHLQHIFWAWYRSQGP
jgi:hypothetical protein